MSNATTRNIIFPFYYNIERNMLFLLAIALFSALVKSHDINDCTLYENNFMICPNNYNIISDNYHVCNNEDVNILYPFNKFNNAFNSSIKSLYTDVTIEDNNIIITPNNNTISEICSINDELVLHNNFFEPNLCSFCICSNGNIICTNKCKSPIIDNTSIRPNYNRISIKNEEPLYYPGVPTHTLLCTNKKCSIEGCNRCSYDINKNEICLSCYEPYYLYTHNPYVCYTSNDLIIECNNFVEYNIYSRRANCALCLHGNSMYEYSKRKVPSKPHTYVFGRCECIKGYYGINCNINSAQYFCNDPLATYNDSTKSCDYPSRQSCLFGDIVNDKCYCNHGYYGDTCGKKIRCVYGHIRHNKCMCYLGFSGRDCSIPLYKNKLDNPLLIDEEVTHRLTDSTCLRGWYGDECDKHRCMNGNYDIITNVCECYDGYSGEYCEYNCVEDCNYNGNSCNYQQKCICENDYYGSNCQHKTITNGIFSYFNYNFKVDALNPITKTFDYCLENNCMQFHLNIPKQNQSINITSVVPFTIHNNSYVKYYNDFDETQNENVTIAIIPQNSQSNFYEFLSMTPTYEVFSHEISEELETSTSDIDEPESSSNERKTDTTYKVVEGVIITGTITMFVVVGIIALVVKVVRRKNVLSSGGNHNERRSSTNPSYNLRHNKNRIYNNNDFLSMSRNPVYKHSVV
jgi:hypothetical protein